MIPVAISPCPNDTFLFYAWAEGKVGHDLPISVTFADIEELNRLAATGQFPLIKMSMVNIAPPYTLLPVGAALGYGVGPKVISRPEPATPRVLLPGERTTANALFSHFFPHFHEKHFCLYHEVLPLLKKGAADYGVIIHETRFTFAQAGFVEVADLGALWEEKYALPLPLGGLGITDALPKQRIMEILRESLAYAYRHKEEALRWVANYSQEKEADVIEKHIALYITAETENLSQKGWEAINKLHEIAAPCHTT